MTMKSVILGAAAAMLIASGPIRAQEIVIWHDLGENGVAWFNRVSAEYQKIDPKVTIKSVSYPTDQWFGRVISAINTGTAPDLIFNNYERVIRIETQTKKIVDLTSVLAQVQDRSFLAEDDLRVATYRGKMIILPVQRVQMGFGVRRSWLDRIGERFPETWEDAKRIAAKFRESDPDGNGRADTFGFALEAAKPRDLIHILDLFMFGSGLRHTLIDPAGTITIDQPAHAQVLEEFLKTYSTYKFVSPDTINHSFAEMYQVIEGGRGGMFRVGDWNVKKWDAQAIRGDFVVGPWPRFDAARPNAVVIGGMRGVAVPENAPNMAVSIAVAKFLLSKDAQQAALETVGSGVRNDLNVETLSERGRRFAQPDWSLIAYDFPEATHAFYPELEAAFHRKLLSGIAAPPADWKAFIKETADEMRTLAKRLASAQ